MTTSAPTPGDARTVDAYYADLWQRRRFDLSPPEQRRWRRGLAYIRRHARQTPPWRVLDYGCGSGCFLPLLAGLGTVDAFDVTPTALEAVAQRHPDLRVVAGDGSYPTPLADDTYDLVWSSEVLEHTLDHASLLADAQRVVRPGGLLLLTTPNARFEARYKAGTRSLQPVENWVDAQALRRLVRAAGFEILDHGTLGAHWANMPYQRSTPYRLVKRALRRLRWWQPIDHAESWLAGRLGRGITLVVVARKPGASGVR